jgi:hypothetical protein
MFAGGLGDLYTDDSMYVLLCTLASLFCDFFMTFYLRKMV